MRRARIKPAVTLPTRRKNNDSNESAKNKPSTPKQVAEKQEPTKTEQNDVVSEQNVSDDPAYQTTPKESPKRAVIEPVPCETPQQSRRSSVQSPLQSDVAPETPQSYKRPETPIVASPIQNKQSSDVRPIAIVSNLTNAQIATRIPIIINVAKDASKIIATTKTTFVEEQRPQNEKTNESTDIIDCISKIPDYNPPSVPESVTEDTVLDGIVPLQSKSSVPKPLDFLKNEIISENAEVLFDPIVPLPSPSKVRPKLRPAPRLAFRRNSIQGSASESEDESRRALLNSGSTTPGPPRQRHDSHTTQFTVPNREVSRVRNDSVCSTVSQVTTHTQPPSASTKDKHSKSRRNEMSRRMLALRRKQRREAVPRESLTMYDLIFYNPTTNPIVPDPDEPTTTTVKEKTKEEPPAKQAKMEEEQDDPPSAEETAAPVPQLKLGPNGEIVLDEQSLVIQQTESTRKLSQSIVHEGAFANGGRGRYSRSRRAADWTHTETVRFYRALAAVGTDFTMMKNMFPDRTRRDLKVKFKKEEKLNGAQVDKALQSQIEWDAIRLETEFAEERRLAAEKAEKEKLMYLEQKKLEKARLRAAKVEGVKHSRGSKAVESTYAKRAEVQREANTADEIIRRALMGKPRSPRKKPQPPPPTHMPIPASPRPPQGTNFATLTKLKDTIPINRTPTQPDVVSISKVTPGRPMTPARSMTPVKTPSALAQNVPQNIEQGSLVVLTVNDPKDPSKKMLQTYVSNGAGHLTPVALPGTLLNSVVNYMKKGTPKSASSNSPQFTSPGSVTSQESRSSVIQMNPSPSKRKRFDSFTITQL
ncbi:uncharacterized protein LOC105380205 [Plutella xylostella]|uniref:uncharacterized protein LOC105380205 n=1 Tax=Plutella xylostella TaxID=51655 RepID=UPI002032C2FE|nr:uncharacterized protein LOC105380205 [Plutella xylostella]